VINWLDAKSKRDQAIDVSKDPMAIQQLNETRERATMVLPSSHLTAGAPLTPSRMIGQTLDI